MQPRSLSHLSNQLLTQALLSLVARDRATTAELLAHLAEFDARKLHRPAGYSSLYEYCVKQLGMSEDMACKRTVAARVARKYPGVLSAIADGRLHLSGIVMLAPYLKLAPLAAAELLASAERRTKVEIALLVATRFPTPDVPTTIRPVDTQVRSEIPRSKSEEAQGMGPMGDEASTSATTPVLEPIAISQESSAPGRVEFIGVSAPPVTNAPSASTRALVAPLSAERYVLQCTIGRELHEKLGRVRVILSHAVPSGDLVLLIQRCVDEFLDRETRRSTPRSEPGQAPCAKDPDHRRIPLEIRRLVLQRDGGRCAFVSDAGRRCESRERLEIDHVMPVAKGGRTDLQNLRLLCRAHNQLAAERELGSEFMRRKRTAASSHREFERSRERARNRTREAG